MEHIERLPEVYGIRQSYTQRLHDNTCAVLIHRYSPTPSFTIPTQKRHVDQDEAPSIVERGYEVRIRAWRHL